MKRPPWLDTALAYQGTREYPGAASNPVILWFWKMAKLSGIKDDMVPWCSGYVCAMLEAHGIRSTRSDGAKSWLTWGLPLKAPALGCIVVFKRPGGYHVGFVVGMDGKGNLQVLGGNQGDEVNIRAFGTNRVMGYRWPTTAPLPGLDPLPAQASVPVSTSEA